jgi:hypothetical protein
MPPKMVKCVMCGDMVTKRQSWDLKALGSKKIGRVCKAHEQIRALVDEMHAERLMQMDMNQATHTLRIMSGIASVQAGYSLLGMPESLVYYRLKQAGYTPDMIAEIKEGVAKQGGPQMSQEQQMMAVMAAADLHRRGAA